MVWLKLKRVQIIDGVQLTALKIINLENGDVLHGMKKNDLGFNGFGEAYFSEIKYNKIINHKHKCQESTT